MILFYMMIFAFVGAFLIYFAGKSFPRIKEILAVVISFLLFLFVALLYGKDFQINYHNFLGFHLFLRINMFSWLFALTITFLGFLSIIFSLSYMKDKKNNAFYYMNMLFVNIAMLGIVLAGDLISFFIFWEIMSWSTFLLISYKKGSALPASMKYIIMSIIGSLSMLIGILYLYDLTDTTIISQLSHIIRFINKGDVIFVVILFSIAFGIKNAVIPFHNWLPPAHSEAPSPFSAILSGILIKMGVYGFLLLFYVIIGLDIIFHLTGLTIVLNVLAAITIIFPTFLAILQNDAKRLLAWSTVAQAGYIFMGITYGTELSVAGGIFHFLNHAIFKALMFLAVGAIEYRTKGIRDLNSLGGFIKKMPFTFAAMLIGAMGLIGLPLTNGFVSKWLIYKTLILNGSPFLAFAALIGTWGTILYSYKLIHNIFLGQLPAKFENIQKAPFSMKMPMMILSTIIIFFGILPGIPLQFINKIIVSFGYHPLNVSLFGIVSDSGNLNIINILAATFVIGVLIVLFFRSGRKSVRVDQYDNYAAGSFIPKEKYSYTNSFYAPLDRFLNSFLKDYIDIFYCKSAALIRHFCNGIRKIYTGYVGSYVMYILLFLAVLIFVQLNWSVF